jgi:hypothetical protein
MATQFKPIMSGEPPNQGADICHPPMVHWAVSIYAQAKRFMVSPLWGEGCPLSASCAGPIYGAQ